MVRLEQWTILSRWLSGANFEVMLWLDVVELHDLLFSRDVRVGGASCGARGDARPLRERRPAWPMTATLVVGIETILTGYLGCASRTDTKEGVGTVRPVNSALDVRPSSKNRL